MSRKLYTVGPVYVADDTLKAMDRPMITHRSKEYKELHKSIEDKLREVLDTNYDFLMVSGSATVLLEGAARSGISRKSLGLTSGSFGDRSIEVAETNGKTVDKVKVPLGTAVKPADIEGKVAKDTEAVHWVSNESSSGVYCDSVALAESVRSQNPDSLIMIDAVTSMFAMDLKFSKVQPDSVVFGTQKALALPPGMAFAA
ncbi:MAG: alanine--glyoxylate aminotransferase family protein, partial [Candidatus Methanomethylophilus sp.]|nr:alanine--glyoxylate aminotransferase family protein [Methanomethylophilus sp.]